MGTDYIEVAAALGNVIKVGPMSDKTGQHMHNFSIPGTSGVDNTLMVLQPKGVSPWLEWTLLNQSEMIQILCNAVVGPWSATRLAFKQISFHRSPHIDPFDLCNFLLRGASFCLITKLATTHEMINDVRIHGGHANGVLRKESEISRGTKDSRAPLIDPSTQKTTPVFDLSVNNLSHLISYKSNDNGLSNSLVSHVDLPAGAHFCYITTHYPIDAPTWSSVQTGPTSHIELGSAWSYSNHSCEPALELFVFRPDSEGRYPQRLPTKSDAPAVDGGDFGVCGEFRVARNRPLNRGDDLHWFYPATEFDVAKPFPCLCGAPPNICIGQQAGAKALSEEQAARYWLNPHIRELRKQSQ